MGLAYACLSGLTGAAVLLLAVANGRLAADYARSRDWASFRGRVAVTVVEALIGAAGVTAALLLATGVLQPD